MSKFKRSYIFILVHVFCWLILALGFLYSHPAEWGDNVPTAFWLRQNLLLAILVASFYLNYYLLIPRLLFKKRVVLYLAIVVAVVVSLTLLNDGVNELFHLNRLPFPHHHPPHHDRWNTFISGMILLMIGLGITISFIKQWQEEVTLRQQLEQEKVTTELTLLKAQINPHFFFNTLNTIYSYTLSDGDVARTAITNLSKMMRYVLYEAAGLQAPLRKEIAFIREYVELMKLRITTKTTVTLKVQDQLSEVMIAPMVFLPFVENAFKHGVSGIEEGHIDINIEQKENYIELYVWNLVHDKKRTHEEQSNGIGIANTRRRLDLLYPEHYTLDIGTGQNGIYRVKLKIFV
jgi:hypothetical protein